MTLNSNTNTSTITITINVTGTSSGFNTDAGNIVALLIGLLSSFLVIAFIWNTWESNDYRCLRFNSVSGQSEESEKKNKCCSGPSLICYFFAALATLTKTFAWWINQFPSIIEWSFMAKWGLSASLAGCEYFPLTLAMSRAKSSKVHLGLMTGFMEATDNFFRMCQQLLLNKPLAWYDWTAAFIMILAVSYQAAKHFYQDQHNQKDNLNINNDESHGVSPIEYYISLPLFKKIIVSISIVITLLIFIFLSIFGGPTGQVYSLGTAATLCKTFAWWINQYPIMASLSFTSKWLIGWSIAALFEYFPLMGAFTLSYLYDVHLGLLTAYMEVLDNLFRMIQQILLKKPLANYDYYSALIMALAVVFQAVCREAI